MYYILFKVEIILYMQLGTCEAVGVDRVGAKDAKVIRAKISAHA